MLFAEAGAQITDFGTQCAQSNGENGCPSHPLGRKQTDVGAIAAKSNAANHQVVSGVMLHPDHIIRAGITDAGAVQAGLDAIFFMLADRMG
jgi:hypothetical protein